MGKITRSLLLIGCLSSMAMSAFGQWRDLLITDLGPAEGLNMRVSDIAQDHSGFVYLCGTQGLVRYDGSTFDYFTNDPEDSTSIGPGEAYNMIVGTDSLIWLTLRFGGLNSFNPRTLQFERFPVPELPYRMVPTAHGILEDQDSVLWVGGHHFQLLQFDRKTKEYKSFEPTWINPEEYGRRLSINQIIQDVNRNEILWLSVTDYSKPGFGGAYGVVSFNKTTGKFVSYPNTGRIELQNPDGTLMGSRYVMSVTEFDPNTGNTEQIPFELRSDNKYILRDIAQVGNKALMIAASSILEMKNDDEFDILFESDDKRKYQFEQIRWDREGNIWVTNIHGAAVIERKKQHIQHFALDKLGSPQRIYPGRLLYDPVGDRVLLSHKAPDSERRVYRIPLDKDEETNAGYTTYPKTIDALALSKDNTAYVASGGKLHQLLTDGSLSPAINSMGFDEFSVPGMWNMRSSPQGWIGGVSSGIFFWFDPSSGKSVRHVRAANLKKWGAMGTYQQEFSGFKFSRNGKYAYLYSGAVHRIDLESGEAALLPFQIEANDLGLQVTDVEEDYEGHLWISSVGNIRKYEIGADTLIRKDMYLVRDGLASSEIHELHCDRSGRIWACTSNGLNCINPETREVRFISTNEGLADPFIDPRQIIETPNGKVVTVNSSGIIVFHPDSLWNSLSTRSVKTALKSIRINGQDIESSEDVNYLNALHLPASTTVVDIQFQGLSFPTDERLRYSYRLNEESDWIGIGSNNFVTLPTLRSGEYNFQVKSADPLVEAPVRTLRITVQSPIYARAWFVALCLALLIVGLVAIYRYRINTIKREEKRKSEINKKMANLELKALRSQMNPHFMFNSLNSIKNYILMAEPKIAAEYLSNFSHLIRLILQNSRAQLITLADEIETLMLYVGLEKLRFEDEFAFHCEIDDNISLQSVQIPPMILQPYVENAIWHGLMHKEEEGRLTIRVKNGGEHIQCIIEDNGVGREASAELKSQFTRKYKSMGMGITQDRIDILNNMSSLGISVEIVDLFNGDNSPAGTRVIFSIPAFENEALID